MSGLLRAATLVAACAAWSPAARALPVATDFVRVFEGVYVLDSGLVVGGVEADLHFNVTPEKLVVHPVPGFDASQRLKYTPAPLYQDQFWLDVTYSFVSYAPAGFENRVITLSRLRIVEFEVRNGVLDEFMFRTAGTLGGQPLELLFDAWTTDTSTLSSASVWDILEGRSEGLFDCPGGPNDVCALFPHPPGFPAGFGFIEKVGTPTEVFPVPAPASGVLALTGLLAIAAARVARRRR